MTGAAIQWLRDGIGIIDEAPQAGPLAASVPDSGGVYVVPAFTGLGSPWWDPYARGAVLGITRGTTRAHLTRAVIEAMAYQTRDVVAAMVDASGTPIRDLRVDGGAAAMDVMLQIQADQLGVPVRRPVDHETTALGAAFLAGLAEGVWPDLASIAARWQLDATFTPADDRTGADLAHAQWLRAVERSRGWERDASSPSTRARRRASRAARRACVHAHGPFDPTDRRPRTRPIVAGAPTPDHWGRRWRRGGAGCRRGTRAAT